MHKKCLFCGRFYRPNPRCKNQKACGREYCQKTRKQLAFHRWHKRNPGYFKGRYLSTKEWRRENIDRINDTKRVVLRSPVSKIALFIPESYRQCMIQNGILLKHIGRNIFLAYGAPV